MVHVTKSIHQNKQQLFFVTKKFTCSYKKNGADGFILLGNEHVKVNQKNTLQMQKNKNYVKINQNNVLQMQQ
jgi:delta-aminolevulinic acid dehydratase/porphobilinogen synthase